MSYQSSLKKRQLGKRVAECVATGQHPSQAYKELYPNASDSTAKSTVSRLMKHDGIVKNTLEQSLKTHGLTPDDLNQRLKKKLDAKRAIVSPTTGEISHVDDNPTQMDAIKTGYKLNNLLQSNTTNIDNRSITMTDLDTNALAKISKDLKEMHKTLNSNTGIQSGEIETQ